MVKLTIINKLNSDTQVFLICYGSQKQAVSVQFIVTVLIFYR